eukprot:IDg8551t1
MTCVTVLKTFYANYPITDSTDSSKIALSAALEQYFTDDRHPVAFKSKTLNAAEQNFAPHNSEMLGIVFAVNAW